MINKLNDKTYRIRVRRGPVADLDAYPLEGELAYTTDTKQLYVADSSGFVSIAIVNTTRVTTTYQALVTDHIIKANTDAGAFTVTLPVGVQGQHIRITNKGSNTLTIDGSGTEKVMDELTQELAYGDTLNLYYDTTEGWD